VALVVKFEAKILVRGHQRQNVVMQQPLAGARGADCHDPRHEDAEPLDVALRQQGADPHLRLGIFQYLLVGKRADPLDELEDGKLLVAERLVAQTLVARDSLALRLERAHHVRDGRIDANQAPDRLHHQPRVSRKTSPVGPQQTALDFREAFVAVFVLNAFEHGDDVHGRLPPQLADAHQGDKGIDRQGKKREDVHQFARPLCHREPAKTRRAQTDIFVHLVDVQGLGQIARNRRELGRAMLAKDMAARAAVVLARDVAKHLLARLAMLRRRVGNPKCRASGRNRGHRL